MITEKQDNIKVFYESSDRYLEICESRDEANFKNILDVISQYVPKEAKLLEFGCGQLPSKREKQITELKNENGELLQGRKH